MSTANWQSFGDVQMYNDKSDPSINFEYLFTLTDPDTGEDPGPASLFNLQTLQQLIELGHKTQNILQEGSSLVYGDTFSLDSDWLTMGQTLNFGDPNLDDTASQELAKKRAYMLYLWMNTTWSLTFEQA